MNILKCNKLTNVTELLARVLLSIMFIKAGYDKIGGYEGTAGWMDAMGVPSILLPLVIILELIGGIMLLIGFQTRIIAFLLSGFTLLAAFLFHFNLEDQMQYLLFMKNITIAGGLLYVFSQEAKNYSLDYFLKSKNQ